MRAQQALFKCVFKNKLHTNNPIIQQKKEYLSMFIRYIGKATVLYNTTSHKSLQFNDKILYSSSHI